MDTHCTIGHILVPSPPRGKLLRRRTQGALVGDGSYRLPGEILGGQATDVATVAKGEGRSPRVSCSSLPLEGTQVILHLVVASIALRSTIGVCYGIQLRHENRSEGDEPERTMSFWNVPAPVMALMHTRPVSESWARPTQDSSCIGTWARAVSYPPSKM